MIPIRKLADKVGWFYVVLSTGCFSGYIKIEPGTAGTIVAIPLYLLLARLGWGPYLGITLLLFAFGVQGAHKIETATDQNDNEIIVIDEIVGYLITMCFLPLHWLYMVLGFGAFRAFDSLKPYPIRKFDKNPQWDGFGVMFDDVLAGIYSNLLLQIVARFVNWSSM